jgi:phage I-like protein
VDLVIDYEHQSLGGKFARADGQAPAAGWIKSLRIKPGEGLLADVQWTESATEMLARRQYRYLSPVVIVRQMDRRAVELHSVALTNTPAMENAEAIVNRRPAENPCPETREVNDMTLNQVRDALQLDEQSDEAAVLTACKRLVEHRDAVLTHLELSADTTTDQLEARLLALSNPPDRVPADEYEQLRGQLAEVQSKLAHQQAAERVTEAMTAGKITEHQFDWAMTLALKDTEAFDSWVAAAPVVVTTGRLTAPSERDGNAGGRAAVIAAARRSYRDASSDRPVICSLAAWVNDELRQHSLRLLSPAESETL